MREPDLDLVCAIAREAGAIALRGFRAGAEATYAEDGVVTACDLASERHVVERVRGLFPEHAVLAEESSKRGAWDRRDGPTWVVDPLDGTSNFAQGLPHWCVSIAFGVRAGDRFTPLHAAIVQPTTGDLFAASRGRGFFHDGRRVVLRDERPLARSLVAVSIGGPRGPASILSLPPRLVTIAARAWAIRMTGSAALDLAWAARGWVGAAYGHALAAWDVCAGALLVEEAFGVVSAADGRAPDLLDPHGIVAAAPSVHASLVRALRATSPRAWLRRA